MTDEVIEATHLVSTSNLRCMAALSSDTVIEALLHAESTLAEDGQPVQGRLGTMSIAPSGRELVLDTTMDKLSAANLKHIASLFKADVRGPRALLRTYPTFYGIIYVADGWLAPERDSAEEYLELLRLHGTIPAIPGAIRSRCFTVIDLDGRAFNLVTRPGADRHIGSTENGDPIGGEVYESLKTIMESVALRLPDGGRAITALGKLKILPLVDDMPSTAT